MKPAEAPRERVLCVDDEADVLEGLELTLGRHFALTTATSGDQALEIIAREAPFAVVMSDMRMPGMNGAALLAAVRERSPTSTRVLLTGHAEVEAAISAINDGQIFRFLTKPCRPEPLRAALGDAVSQHRLLVAEKQLLEQTLRGSIQALCEVLAITDPDGFGHGEKLVQLVMDTAAHLGQSSWQLELAARLLGLGRISVPAEVLVRHDEGAALGDEELAMIERMPGVVDRLLSPIPRLEVVREIQRLATVRGAKPALADSVENIRAAYQGALILRTTLAFDALRTRGLTGAEALAELREADLRSEEAVILDAIAAVLEVAATGDRVMALTVRQLRAGMVLAEDLHTLGGQLLVRRGYIVTETFVERLRNLRAWALKEPIHVVVPKHGGVEQSETEESGH